MATINQRMLVNAGIGVAMLGLLVWNMQQCSSINEEKATNEKQDKRFAKVDTVLNDHASHINNMIDAIGRVDKKANANSKRIDDLDSRLSEVTDSVDSLRVRVDSIKPCPCAEKKNNAQVPAAPRQSKKSSRKKYNSASAAVAGRGNGAYSSANVTAVQQNGNNNTVNVNTGTVNNYYSAPAAVPAAPKKQEIECISASATIETVHTVVITKSR